MQPAALFAFARARAAQVEMVALVSNGVDDIGAQLNTGGHEFRVQVLDAVARAAQAYLRPSRAGSTEGGQGGVIA